eukprot:gene4511-14672_t
MRLCEDLGMGVIAHDPDTALDIDDHKKRLARTIKLYAAMFGEEAGRLWHEDAGHEAASLSPTGKLEAVNATKSGNGTTRRLPGREPAKTCQTKMDTCGEERLRVFVKTLTGETLTVYARARYTIYQLKTTFYEIIGTPQHKQRLIFAGRHMEDFRTLADYGIQKDSIVHMVLRLSGC